MDLVTAPHHAHSSLELFLPFTLPREKIMSAVRCLLLMLVLTACPAQAAQAEQVVLFLGDSLTAGLGVEPEQAYPRLLGDMLIKEGMTGVRIINGGLSGSTSASALSRLQWYDKKIRPSLLFLALGANDGLRGLTLAEMEKNLTEVINAARERGMRIILAGMELPPNYGDEYTGHFRQVYRDLAARYGLTLIPFLLEGVGGVAGLNQADGIHPNAEGHQHIARHVYPVLRRSLDEILAQQQKNSHDRTEKQPAY
jgi:acyl-CoA thioesterase-1